MDIIKYWEEKNMYISIFSILHKGKIEWTAGIRIGLTDKNNWLTFKDEGCQFSSFLTYENALNAADKFCKEYKPKQTKIILPKKKK